ncbi:hypothetical protein [Amylibacter marinus]|nr:hypothetical protein [Amylibacter marinus]
MKLHILCALIIGTAAQANIWQSETQDGVLAATVQSEKGEISVFCDVGINAPITSINFLIQDSAPAPLSNVALFFDKEPPIFVQTDIEGALGSTSETEAQNFSMLLERMRGANALKVRLFNGISEKFTLKGSTSAISNCTPDYQRLSMGLN